MPLHRPDEPIYEKETMATITSVSRRPSRNRCSSEYVGASTTHASHTSARLRAAGVAHDKATHEPEMAMKAHSAPRSCACGSLGEYSIEGTLPAA